MTRLRSAASFFWFFGAAALLTAAALTGGCSVLFHADASQCSTDTDCVARGSPFDQYAVCKQGTCVPGSMNSSTADAGCTKNSDCLEAGVDPCQSGVACNVDTGQCLNLTASGMGWGCNYVIGDYCGANQQPSPAFPPIFLGAFASFPGDPLSDPGISNYTLAVDEFSALPSGVPAGPSGPGNRSPVVIVCDVAGSLDDEMNHLIGDLGVSTIITPIPLSQLGSIFTTYGAPGANPLDGGPGYRGTFMINPFGGDSTLANLMTDGLLWHMLGSPADLAPAYGAFMPLIEAYVRNNPPWNLGPWTPSDGGSPAPMKVATVSAPNQVLTDLAGAATPLLTWNGGKTAQENMNNLAAGTDPNCPCQTGSNYCALQLTASTLTLSTPPVSATDTNYADLALCLVNWNPQVIISFASTEFVPVLETIEASGKPGVAPFYLLSAYNDSDPNIASFISASQSVSRDARFAGINYADPADASVYADYQNRFVSLLNGPGASGEVGNNYYDAMYFAIYSLAAAGRGPVSVDAISTGMTTLVVPSPLVASQNVLEVGPTDMPQIFSDISQGQSISLVGTLGPPNFNEATGARISQGDVYCIQYAADAGMSPTYDYDVLRLANPDGGPAPDGGGPLAGSFPCYPGIQ